ncbi:MAG: Fic family protein [Thermodesulfobacteriota bacterium]|jgi:Fic family protein
MSFNPSLPYDNLPLLPPAVPLETPAVLKKAIGANRLLAELKGMGGVIPNPGVLIRTIALQEARVSSEIENIVTTNDELYRALDGATGKVDPHAKEVLRYQDALWAGYEAIRKRPLLTTNLFVELARTITGTMGGIRRVPGTKIANSRGEVIYTPPEGEARIRELLGNLEKFIHAEDGLDPLVKLAVMHYQFEAIHPFTDGNGRTGRILNILYLVQQELLEQPILYLSHYIIQNKAGYYTKLRAVTEAGAWEDWVLYMLEAVEATARTTRDKILAIRDLMDGALEIAREKGGKWYSKELVELIFTHPYCKIRFLEEAGIAKRQAASKYLQEIEAIGLLSSVKKGREVYYVNEPLLKVLVG